MKKDPRRFAPLGLLLSGLALLAIVGVTIIYAFKAVGLYTPPDTELLNRILIVAFALFIVGFAIYALLNPDRVRTILTGRQMQYGSNSTILFIAFTGILVVINILVQQYPQRWDVTEDKQHTLAPETIQALETLPEPVYATAFYSAQLRLNNGSAEELLKDFKSNSNGNFDYQFTDPESNPVLVNQLGITGDGKILLQMGENQEIVTSATESALTNGLVRLLNPDKPAVYFLTGEGEHDIESSGDDGYSRVKQVLGSKNYVINTLNLQAENAIPEDARAIVVAGPIVPLTENSVALIKNYMDNGGSLLVLADPVPLTQFGDQPDLLAEYLASNWGITLNNDIVVDTNSPYAASVAIGAQITRHPITEKMQGVAAVFPSSRSITVDQENTEVFPTPLILTLDQSWGETDFSGLEQQVPVSYDEGVDLLGPMTLAATAENSTTNSRIVVIGNSSFATNSYFDVPGNGDLFANTIDWLAEKESLIGLTERNATERTFKPISAGVRNLVLLSTFCLIPLAIIIAGVYAWFMRRRRG